MIKLTNKEIGSMVANWGKLLVEEGIEAERAKLLSDALCASASLLQELCDARLELDILRAAVLDLRGQRGTCMNSYMRRQDPEGRCVGWRYVEPLVKLAGGF